MIIKFKGIYIDRVSQDLLFKVREENICTNMYYLQTTKHNLALKKCYIRESPMNKHVLK